MKGYSGVVRSMAKWYLAEEVADMFMNDKVDDLIDGYESDGSETSDSIVSTTEYESLEEPSSESEVGNDNDQDLSSTMISSKKTLRTRGLLSQPLLPFRDIATIAKGNLGLHGAPDLDISSEMSAVNNLETCSEISEISVATSMSETSAASLTFDDQATPLPPSSLDFDFRNYGQPLPSMKSKRKNIPDNKSEEYDWEKTSKPAAIFPFAETPGLNIDMPCDATPLDYFKIS